MPEDGPSLEDLLARIDALTDELIQTKLTFSEAADTFRNQLAESEEEILRLRRMLELATGVKAPTTEAKRKRRWGVGGTLAVAGAAAAWPARKAIENPHLPTLALLGSGAYLTWTLAGPPPILEMKPEQPPIVAQPHIPQPPGIGVPETQEPSPPMTGQPAGNRTRTPELQAPNAPGSAPEPVLASAEREVTQDEPESEPQQPPSRDTEPPETPPEGGGQSPRDDDTEPPGNDQPPDDGGQPPDNDTPPPDDGTPPDNGTDIGDNQRCLVDLKVDDLAHAKLLCD